jgi:CARDB
MNRMTTNSKQLFLTTLAFFSALALFATVAAQEVEINKNRPPVYRPDLVILSAKKVASDEKGVKFEVQVRNAGPKAAGPFELIWHCDWQPKEPKEFGGDAVFLPPPPIPGLAAKQTKTLTYVYCARLEPKATKVILKMEVDPKDAVKESNESNNKYEIVFRAK